MLYVGTSGWQYRDWRPGFYPDRLPQRLWLESYAERFCTVEINNAFYRLPEKKTFEQWRERSPAQFRFAVKMSRYLTHIKRLQDPAEPVSRFLDRAAGLGDKLGPVLLQLPPTLKADARALAETLKLFPRHVRVAVEPRHDSWWTDEIKTVLGTYNAALSWADRRAHSLSPLWVTADWGYLRLHEGRAKPWPRYGDTSLSTWAKRLPANCDGWVYFNNDQNGAAPRDAATFSRLARRAGHDVT